jgi:glycosyltransferase involved in cell wall biosynthesis
MSYNAMVGFSIEILWCCFVNNFNAVVTLTMNMKDYYRHKLPENSLFYIYNGITQNILENIDPEDERRILMLKNKYLLVGVSARLITRKGIDQLIKLLSIDSHIAVAILGDGPEKSNLIKLATQLKVVDRCLFLGYRKHAINYYRYFDVYAMVSRSEGFGLCVIEAASQKVPVVCADIPTFFELFTEEEVVRYKLDDVESLKNAVNYIVQYNSKYADNVYMKYLKCYSSSIMASNYLNLYERIMNNKNPFLI